MDQLRAILKIVWRERFWVLSVVGVLVAVVCWHLSASDLDAQFVSRKQAIETTFSNMQTLSQETPHPNDKVNEGNREQAREQSKNVLAVWEELYDRQRNEVLFWPKDVLKSQFIKEIEKLKFRDPFPVKKAEEMRTHYWNYIGNRFDGLLKIIQALKTDDQGRFAGGAEEGRGSRRSTTSNRTEGEPIAEDYLVQWLDQGQMQSKLQFKSKPTALQIWVTQEDLWVCESLLNVIAKTNKDRGATRPDNTAVRVISNLDIGRNAAAASRSKAAILMPRSATGEGEEGGGDANYSSSDGDVISMREGGEDAEVSDEAVLANRYLDADGNPYPGEPEDKEFRRVPVRMRLLMDQRYLPQLLVNCANAALPVEVKQVRVNPDQSGAGFGGEGRSGASRTSFRGMEEVKNDPNLADVEIRGVVYIYNQPDKSIFESLTGGDQLADASASGQ